MIGNGAAPELADRSGVELVEPEAAGLVGMKLLKFLGDKIAIETRRRRINSRDGGSEISGIEREQLGEHGGDAPAVENSVMKAERELKREGGSAMNEEGQQRRSRPLNMRAFFGIDPVGD